MLWPKSIGIFILVIVYVTDGEIEPVTKVWHPLSPDIYPDVLEAFVRAFHKPKKHGTFNRVKPMEINMAAIQVGVEPPIYGASFKVDFEHSAENPECENFIAVIQLGNTIKEKPVIENWSCYFKDERAFSFNKMVQNLNIMVP